MFRNGYRLCEAFGIPIYVDFSFAILLLMFVSSENSFVYGVTGALLLAISVVLHELGHSLAARAFGYRTDRITISLLGGCASLIALPRKASQEFLTAIAGPFVSFALSALAYAAGCFLPVRNEWLAYALWFAMWMNLVLGAFNLLPGFPMDGGRIFRSVLRIFFSRPKATWIAMVVGRIVAVLLALRGFNAVVSGGSFGFVSLLIAWMIWKEGYREYVMALAEPDDFRSWTQADYNARVSPPPYERD